MDLSELIAQLRQSLTPSGSVVKQAVASGIWEGGMNTVNRLIQLAKITILARILPPKEFGILGVGFLTLAVFESFSQLGIDHALIQRQHKDVDEYLDTSWTLQILRGLLLSTTVFLIAPYAAAWFGEPRATNVIRALGIGPLLLGIKNPGAVYFRKGLQFHRRFIQILSGTIVNFITAIVLGVLLESVWALVAGSVVGNVISVVASYVLHGYRPSPRLDFERARELINYGKWIFGNSIAGFLKDQGDDIFVGWFLGATPLAFYQMAYRFSNAPSTELTSVVSNVMFPSLSQVQNDYQKLRTGYFRAHRLNVFLALPAAAGIAFVASPFVRVMFGTDWLPMVPVMQMLAALGAVRVINSGNGPVYQTLSRPDIGMKLNVVRVLLIAVGIYPAADEFGAVGVAAVIVGSVAIIAPVGIYIALQMIQASVVKYLRNIIHPLVGSVGMSLILLFVTKEMPIEPAALELVTLIIIGAVTYGVYIGIAMFLFNYEIGEDLSGMMNALRSG